MSPAPPRARRALGLVVAVVAGLAASVAADPAPAQYRDPALTREPVRVLPLFLPAPATETARRVQAPGRQRLPVGAWTPQGLPTLPLEGRIEQTAWRLDSGETGTLALLSALRTQLRAEGYEVLFECGTEECGGFDFRYQIDILPEPEMHVDLGDFRYLSARKGSGPTALHLGVVLSRSREAGYLQITTVAPGRMASETGAGPQPTATTLAGPVDGPATGSAVDGTGAQAGEVADGDVAGALERLGHVALDDLTFDSGSAELSPGAFASLGALADYLRANPARSIVLVGHTDAQGGLAANVALSRRRSESVLARLVSMGVPAGQLAAEGVGYLAPRASNLTEDGRRQNRRVEAMLTSTQ